MSIPALSISDILTAPSQQAFRAQMVTALVTMGVPADKWRAGGVASTMLTVVAITLASMAALLQAVISGFFLPFAKGSALQNLAYYVYGINVAALQATFASGVEQLTNNGTGNYTLVAGNVTFANARTGQTYTNTNASPVVLAPGQTVTVPVQATTIGIIGNANPGEVSVLQTPLNGVSVTNPAAVLGQDLISDPSLRQLCTNALGARSVRGVRSAYDYAIATAVNTVSGTAVNINRWKPVDSHTGVVPFYIASPAGAVDPNDHAGVVANIELVARPIGVAVNVIDATTVAYPNAITVYVKSPAGLTTDAIKASIGTSLGATFEDVDIGGDTSTDDQHVNFTGLFADQVKAAIGAGVTMSGARLISTQGATDLALTTGQVPVDAIVLTVHSIGLL